MTRATRAVIVSGSGRYADPWHPFPATSGRIAGILADAGYDVVCDVDGDVDASLAASPATDLVVLNIGRPDGPHPSDAAVRAGLLAHLAAGGPLLAMHVTATSLPQVPEWESILGGVWVRGTTYHPEYGPARIEIADRADPITAGIADFEVLDERYTDMRISSDARVLAQHRLDGVAHPVLWTHRYGDARIVYDALGHDASSYDSPEHRTVVRRAADWLTRRDDAAGPGA